MSRKSATAVKEQPALFAEPQTAKPIAKVEPKPKKTGSKLAVVTNQPRTLIERLREISDAKDVVLAREILAMIRSEEDRVAERAFNVAMLAVQSAIPPIKRNSFNKHTKSWWAKLETISKIADPIIHKHGFSLSYGTETSPLPEHYRIICDVSHRDGHRRRYDLDVGMDSKGPKGEGNKSLAQGSISSTTYARRGLKCMIFDIVIEGMDNDGNAQEPRQATVIDQPSDPIVLINDNQAETLVELIESKGRTRAAFCKSWQIDKVGDLPAIDYQTAVEKLKALKHV